MKPVPWLVRWPAVLVAICAILLAGCGALASSARVDATPVLWGATSEPAPTVPAPTLGAVPRATQRPTARPRPQTRATATPAAQSAPAPRSGLPLVAAATLPPEAQATLALIAQGGPFPFARDGVEFQNREHLLPGEPRGYYHEYTVVTPGEHDRGARRIITGSQGEIYYTPDHYASFVQVQPA